MKRTNKDENIVVGHRLSIIRENLGYKQEEFAALLGITIGQYSKIERGETGLSVEKIQILYDSHNIDPTYLLTGNRIEGNDVDYIMANCDKEKRNEFLKRVLAYLNKLID